eukprot:TRINITY_DN61875_c0_g1_i1.p1 TRINITY_DN61875_c0_g1~~TRINITY_DN61875_c0_g1_i1.p1  ORF type:complete len:683 (-),score=137.21 TRINITY_DN61875_c0_g1_i1:85-2133(-)
MEAAANSQLAHELHSMFPSLTLVYLGELLRLHKGHMKRTIRSVKAELKRKAGLELSVAIVGGGIGGLALALALQKRGIQCRVFERDEHFGQRRQGYGLTMQQGTAALRSLGLGGNGPGGNLGVHSTCHKVFTNEGRLVGEWGQRVWGRDASKKSPSRSNFHIPRQALRKLLLDALRPGTVAWGNRFVRYSTLDKAHSQLGEGRPRARTRSPLVHWARLKPRWDVTRDLGMLQQDIVMPSPILRSAETPPTIGRRTCRAANIALEEEDATVVERPLLPFDLPASRQEDALDTVNGIAFLENTRAASGTALTSGADVAAEDVTAVKVGTVEPAINHTNVVSHADGAIFDGEDGAVAIGCLGNVGDTQIGGQSLAVSETSVVGVDSGGYNGGNTSGAVAAGPFATTELPKVIGEGATTNMVVEFLTKDDETVRVTADIVVGCDGINGGVRQQLFGEERSPLVFLGCLVVLGIVDNLPAGSEGAEVADGATTFQMSDGTTRLFGMPFDAERTMWQLSFPYGKEDAEGLSRKGGVALREEALRRCGPWAAPVPQLLESTDAGLISGWPVVDRPLLDAAAFENDGCEGAVPPFCRSPVTLLGDAAHPMSPFKGQGANQALQDATLLAKELHESGGSLGLLDALRRFEAEMLLRSAPKVLASREAASFLHSEIACGEGNKTRAAIASGR